MQSEGLLLEHVLPHRLIPYESNRAGIASSTHAFAAPSDARMAPTVRLRSASPTSSSAGVPSPAYRFATTYVKRKGPPVGSQRRLPAQPGSLASRPPWPDPPEEPGRIANGLTAGRASRCVRSARPRVVAGEGADMVVANSVVLVTGSTDGVGKLVARELARACARVLLHGRSRETGAAVLRESGMRPGANDSSSTAPTCLHSPRSAPSPSRFGGITIDSTCSSTTPASAAARATPRGARRVGTGTSSASLPTTSRTSCSRSSCCPRWFGARRRGS